MCVSDMAAQVMASTSAHSAGAAVALRARPNAGEGKRSVNLLDPLGFVGVLGWLAGGDPPSSQSDSNLVRSGEFRRRRGDARSGLRKGLMKLGIRSGVRTRDRRDTRDLTADMMLEDRRQIVKFTFRGTNKRKYLP